MMAGDWQGRDGRAAGTEARRERDASASDDDMVGFPPPAYSTTTSTERPRTSQGFTSTSSHRRSYQETVPALPAIPARFLKTGRPASIGGPPESPASPKRSRRNVSRGADIVPEAALRVEKVRGSGGGQLYGGVQATRGTSWYDDDGIDDSRHGQFAREASATPSPRFARRKSVPTLAPSIDRQSAHTPEAAQGGSGTEDMARRGRAKDEDLFMELARDDAHDHVRPPSRSDRVASRLSEFGNRRSLPPAAPVDSSNERRPKSSGNVFPRTSSRLSGFPSDLQRHVDRYRQSPSRREDTTSIPGRSASGRAGRFGSAPDVAPAPSRLAERMRSPDMPSFGRRRPSYGAPLRQTDQPVKGPDSQDESPADSSEPKRSLPDSASVESTADTVWDELDELKSRIKKLELTGKLPPTSGAGVSGDSSDRPRTATTAPTTIDSSPKHERKPEVETKPAPTESAVGGPNAANIHPLLHAALTKAKPLLNGPLYRSLEATAADALQLAAMTGSAGPQGTTFSAASIINGVTVSDRHVRRKADTMCRNLTDLTLALCDGKHEAPSAVASPITLEPLRKTPSIRSSRSRLGRGASPAERSMSRLEARRTSILGLPPTGSLNDGSTEDVSNSEQETTPSHTQPQLRRTSRAGSRLLSARMPRYDDVSGDDDPTIRPPSRAMTDIGNLRSKIRTSREQDSPGQSESPSLRSGLLAARRANASAFESNREQSRVVSLNVDAGRRRFAKESTPPVMEEEVGDSGELQSLSQPKRRITSFGQFSARRAQADPPSRAASLSQRRQTLAE